MNFTSCLSGAHVLHGIPTEISQYCGVLHSSVFVDVANWIFDIFSAIAFFNKHVNKGIFMEKTLVSKLVVGVKMAVVV